MEIFKGDKVLITAENWFYGPDGKQYKGVFGTVKGVFDAEKTLGVRPNAKSTNWYVQVGNMVLAGCQVHYIIKTNQCELGNITDWNNHEGKVVLNETPSKIYNADA